MKKLLVLVACLALLLVAMPAGVAVTEIKLTPSDAGPPGSADHFHFGFSVAAEGDTIVVGAFLNEAAYVFTPDGMGGHDEVKLAPSDGSYSYFGQSVAVSGDTIVVGAPRDDTAASSAGAVYVFKPDGSGGYDETKLVASDAAAIDYFGEAVAVSGRTIYVGAPRDGSVYVFSPDGAGGFQETKLTASDAAVSDGFGNSVAVSGDILVVGAAGADDVGAVYVFTPDRFGDYRETRLTASDAADGDGFGGSVAVSGRTIVAGADEAAYVFVPRGRRGYREEKLTASDSTNGFGWSVAVSGSRIVVGAPFDGDSGWVSGAAYLYTPNRSGGYDESKITASDAVSGENFGWSVAVSGRAVVAGAPVNDLADLLHSGSAYLFQS